jgi:hypothetical protein
MGPGRAEGKNASVQGFIRPESEFAGHFFLFFI